MTSADVMVLHGAIKNVGDFLIRHRALELLAHARPDLHPVLLFREAPLSEHIKRVNSSRAVVLCGGPGYSASFYPGTFTLHPKLDAIEVPVVPLGLGWSGAPPLQPEKFRFDEASIGAVRWIHERIATSSTRDVMSQSILHQAGVPNVTMTGCVAWYHLPTLDRDFEPPQDVRKLVFTAPARKRNVPQLAQVIRRVRRLFPAADSYLVFHRGILPDKGGSPTVAVLNSALAAFGVLTGLRVVSVPRNLDAIAFYGECDLHVGYRVHAHLDFLSRRKPSILVQEDGRGIGQTATLHTKDVWCEDPDVPTRVSEILQEHVQSGFHGFGDAMSKMRAMYPVMREFLESI